MVSDGPVDNIFSSQGLLYLLNEEGFKESVSGGRLFEFSIEYAINSTFKSYGETDQLDTTRVDVFDAARYSQKIFAGTIQFTDLELARNQEPGRKFDVLEKKLENGRKSAAEQLNAMLYKDGTGNASLDMDGLARIIPDDPTLGTVGGIAPSFTFWRSRSVNGVKTATAYDNLIPAMTTCVNLCTLGGVDAYPTGIVMDRATFEAYEASLVKIERLVRNDGQGATGGDIGFLARALEFKGIPAIYDELCTAQHVFVLNNRFLKLLYLKGAWMRMKDPIEPGDRLTASYRVYTFGNLTASARRHLGVVYNTAT